MEDYLQKAMFRDSSVHQAGSATQLSMKSESCEILFFLFTVADFEGCVLWDSYFYLVII